MVIPHVNPVDTLSRRVSMCRDVGVDLGHDIRANSLEKVNSEDCSELNLNAFQPG